jgi:hypothetical protein
MANTLTTISQSMLQDEVLPALKLGLSPLSAMSFATNDKPLSKGDSVIVPVVSAKSAGTYSSTFESGDSTVTGTSVTIGAPTFSSWYVNPHTEGIPTAERFLAQGREAAYAVAKSVVQGVLSNFVEANIGTGSGDESVIAAANYDVDDQADMLEKLQGKGVNSGISAIHNLAFAAALRKDAALQDASAYGNNGLISTGELPPIFGIRQFYTDAFPSAVTSENTGVIFTGKSTAAIAVGAYNNLDQGLEASAGVRNMVVTDPDTGLSMTWRTWVNSGTGVYWGSVYVAYGTSFIQDAAVRVVTA